MTTAQAPDPEGVTANMIKYPGHGGDAIDAFFARPAAEGTYPAVVVIEEAFGLVDHIKDVARQFAGQGYVAIAPELYSREGPPDLNDMSTLMPKMMGMPDVRAVGDLEGAAVYLKGLPFTTGKVGIVGFCSGGRQSLMFACRTRSIDAAVDCYGGFMFQDEPTESRPVAPFDMIADLSCPLLGLFGEEDQNPSVEHVERLRQELTRHNKSFDIHSYPNAGHAFFADYRPSYHEETAKDAWQRMLAWYDRHLK